MGKAAGMSVVIGGAAYVIVRDKIGQIVELLNKLIVLIG